MMSAGDVLKTLVETPLGVTYITAWGHPQDVIFQRPKGVGEEHPQYVNMGRPLALYRGPYRDLRKLSFRDDLRTSLGHNFAEWEAR